MKYWETIADNLSKAGWSWGCVSAIDSNGRTIWIADAHRDNGKRFIEAAIPYNLACYYCQLEEIETAKRYLKKAFEIDLNWRRAALEDEDLKPLWDSL